MRFPNEKLPEKSNPAFMRNQTRRNSRWESKNTSCTFFRDTSNNSSSNNTNQPPQTPPTQQQQPSPFSHRNNQQNYDPAGVRHNLYDSLQIFGLGNGANFAKVKQIYKQLALKYHLNKHDTYLTELTQEEAKAFFQLINNAQSYLKKQA